LHGSWRYRSSTSIELQLTSTTILPSMPTVVVAGVHHSCYHPTTMTATATTVAINSRDMNLLRRGRRSLVCLLSPLVSSVPSTSQNGSILFHAHFVDPHDILDTIIAALYRCNIKMHLPTSDCVRIHVSDLIGTPLCICFWKRDLRHLTFPPFQKSNVDAGHAQEQLEVPACSGKAPFCMANFDSENNAACSNFSKRTSTSTLFPPKPTTLDNCSTSLSPVVYFYLAPICHACSNVELPFLAAPMSSQPKPAMLDNCSSSLSSGA
jgi:hypothetical protein